MAKLGLEARSFCTLTHKLMPLHIYAFSLHFAFSSSDVSWFCLIQTSVVWNIYTLCLCSTLHQGNLLPMRAPSCYRKKILLQKSLLLCTLTMEVSWAVLAALRFIIYGYTFFFLQSCNTSAPWPLASTLWASIEKHTAM